MAEDGSNSEAETKSIRVSIETHQELARRKFGDESYDDVLKRELGLVPRTIKELTSPLPDRLATATDTLVTEYVKRDEFRPIYKEHEGNQTLQFVSPTTDRAIYEITVYYPTPDIDRVNHRVDIRYRNPKGRMERIAQFRDIEAGAVDIEYTDFETRETKETTRKGDTPGEATAEKVGKHVPKFVEMADDRWGGAPDQTDNA